MFYEYHSKITKNGEVVVYLVSVKLPFSVLTVNSEVSNEPLFLFEAKHTLLNHLASYEHPLSLLGHIFTSTISTHSPYVIYKLDEILLEENNVPEEYRQVIHEKVEHFKSILEWNNIRIYSETKHYIFYEKNCFVCLSCPKRIHEEITTPVVSKHSKRIIQKSKSSRW